MDRTHLAPYKAEEKELNDILLKKLTCLTKIFPPSEEMRKCLCEDLFVKSNPAAFFLVFHYLFTVLDAAEFKKRFFWPITDKRAESNFRTAAVDYLKHLNEKHNLQINNIASCLLVKTGGMKFINLMLQIVTFVIQEVTKQRERQLMNDYNLGVSELRSMNPFHLREKNGFLKEYSSAYLSDCQETIEEFQNQTKNLSSELEKLLEGTDCSMEMLLNGNVLAAFEKSNQELYENNFVKPLERMEQLNVALDEAKEIVDNFYATEGSRNKINKEAVQLALKTLQGDEDNTEASNSSKMGAAAEDLSMNNLITAFNKIYPHLTNALQKAHSRTSIDETRIDRLNTIKTLFDEVETQITEYQKWLKGHMNDMPNNHNDLVAQKENAITPTHSSPFLQHPQFDNFDIMEKYVMTPPIKLDVHDMPKSIRLPLLNQLNIKRNFELSETLGPLRSIAKLKPKKNESYDGNITDTTTINCSKIMDPMELLRTIQKKSYKKPNVNLTTDQCKLSSSSSSCSKWRDRQRTFGLDMALESDDAMPEMFKLCDNMELNCHTQFPDVSSCNANAILPVIKLSAVKKVQNASLNLNNLSTSPSGRLEPLYMDALDDETLLPKNSCNAYNNKCIEKAENCNEICNENAFARLNEIANSAEEDALINVSDSVLKDVPM